LENSEGNGIAGFNLSLAGLELLRCVDIGEGRYMRGMIPSRATMMRTARKVEVAAEQYCLFRMIGGSVDDNVNVPGFELDNSNENHNVGTDNTYVEGSTECDSRCDEDETFAEGFEFDVVRITRTLSEAFGLADVAKERSIELRITSDGAQLTNTISHVAAGLKVNDMALRNPITKCPLILHEPESLVQSLNL
jgi:hypothetical protein